MLRLQDKTAFVTGGASGIGAATVHRLAEEGARVIVGDVDIEGASVVAKAVEGIAVAVDVSDVASVRRAVASVEDRLGVIDLLVNNAGTDRSDFFLDTDDDTWDFVLQTNLRGAMACTRAVLPGMYKKRSGAIVNVASAAGVVGMVGGAAYCASKAGLIGFTKAIAREGSRYGVRSNAVAPGPIDTPLLDTAESVGPKGLNLRQMMIDATVMGRVGRPEEVAAAIAFLASDDASYVTGHTLAVSGGVSMS